MGVLNRKETVNVQAKATSHVKTHNYKKVKLKVKQQHRNNYRTFEGTYFFKSIPKVMFLSQR